ncbi:aconitate hydratase AcnA [Streptococcus gallolyticus subsp. gallolyticus]|uniref:Aconitate hydratase n=1 Tax=Streptococcus gallolyticus TaxID=315405 RepID=A0A927XI93_9STRE|nr:aconitate hydratase AcnA [Streptococcus gallolyticus]MBE6163837.1 aconitate hydratase AcnA [Streptococcus gallolyticus]MCY7155666.1 aconitate hydratase AcnA [Streptococcus gallolyticus subsp. gallolyticus]MCY7174423.1 aconitate hydratase AcnA [Streptococcus gallolyticus subsp. gallolyticus]MCY7176543.1 aconitate hydratase AcnA [Streptococcus gallolyticus subsp. gallolyticus]MCY7180996.1 aconitate hydratase AcnA [Streptococcus gallolyticus subsp. gallolyticus]
MTEFLSKFSFKDGEYSYFNLEEAVSHYGGDIKKIPYTIRILLESLLRKYDGVDVTKNHIENLATYNPKKTSGEVPFKPSRVILQDFTGVPVVVDLASMRDAIVANGGDAELINPEIPVDLVIDHSVQVDFFGCDTALEDNINLEFKRNNERYEFLKWAEKSFDNYRAVPPATGIIHQVNIEFLSDVVIEKDGMLYPDSMFGTDSHTTMINGIGVLGWGVGGIEAEAAMLGEASFFPVPEVIGVRLTGKLPKIATATDLALKVTQVLRQEKVVGKFVEYFGDGLSNLSLAERATIANMAPEYGATCGYFPIDDETLNYMRLTNRKEDHIALTKEYVKHNNLFYDPEHQAEYTKVVEIDLSTISPSISGPKRPQDLIDLTQAKQTFQESLVREAGVQGFGLTADEINKKATVHFDDQDIEIQTGHVAIAAITSCTNTSNPYVLMSAGLLAKNAVERGLRVAPTVKTSLAPGSKVVTGYLRNSGLQTYLDTLGFNIVGYGCTTCIGNSGSLRPEVAEAITETDLLASAVLSGNRNFEGRVNPLVKANFLASPPLVVAYALAGNTNIDLTTEPLGFDQNNAPVYLKDIMPTNDEVAEYVNKYVTRELFEQEYEHVFTDSEKWNQIPTEESKIYHWNESSTYIQNPPYFDNLGDDLAIKPLKNLKPLAKFGDSVTTDHISPAGNIAKNSPAAKYLDNHGVDYVDFNSYGSRRGNHEVMMRGTFANIRIQNQLADGKIGGYTKYNGEIMPIYDAAMHYKEDNVDTLVIAGKDYGMGSSRDWAAKGSNLLGVKAVLAESFERIHRSNLVMMGVLPLQFLEGDTAESLGLTGLETYDINLSENPGIHDIVDVVARDDSGEKHFKAMVRFDADADIRYYKNGGILPMVVRKKLEEA